MELPELRMTFADRAGLARELDQNLRHGRAFLCQQTDIPVLSECVLVLIHPELAQELRLSAQVVMVNASGIGLSLSGGYAAELESLRWLAAQPEAPQLTAAEAPADVEPARTTYVPEALGSELAGDEPPLQLPPMDAEADRVTFVPAAPLHPSGDRVTLVPELPEPERASAADQALRATDAERVTYVPELPDAAMSGDGPRQTRPGEERPVYDPRVTYVPELPGSRAGAQDAALSPVAALSDSPPATDGGPATLVPGAPDPLAAQGGEDDALDAARTAPGDSCATWQTDPAGAAASTPAASGPLPAAPYLEIGEPVDESSFADVEEELAAESGNPSQQPEPEPADDAAEPEAPDALLERELDPEALTPSGRPRAVELQTQETRQERLRHLNAAQQLKVARTGELADRIAVERLYGKQVWEALLHNPRLTVPEVARIARKGTVPKPLLDVILDNAAWIKADAVRRALLSNPKVGPEAVLKLLRATPKHELKIIEKGTAYGAAVRETARKLLRQP